MILETSARHGDFLADGVSFNGKYLSPISGSPLANIVSTLSAFAETDNTDDIINQSIIPGSSRGTHEEMQTRYLTPLVRAISNIINAAKNIVNPHCLAIIKKIDEKKKTNSLNMAGILGDIVTVEVPAILSDELFNSLIENYSNSPEKTITRTMEFFDFIQNNLTTEEVKDLIKTGSPALDLKINDYLPNVAELIANGVDTIDISRTPLKYCVFYFLLLTGIQNERNDKIIVLNENSDDRLKIAEWRAGCAGRILRDTKAVIDDITEGTIVVRNSYLVDYFNDYTVYVYGPTYRDWIKEKGGSPEALMGLRASGVDLKSVGANQKLTENVEKYKSLYVERLEHAKHLAIMNDLALVKRVTNNYMTDAINAMEDINYPDFHKRLALAMQHEYHSEQDLPGFLIKVVARTLFPAPTEDLERGRSDVKDLLIEVHGIVNGKEGIDYDTAVYLAVIRLIGKYLRRQIQVVPN